jgi:Na+-transporting methylmalonyl-CoA/oxaloacetate decarboxylase gamma subunit
MLENLVSACEITLIGMGLVFAAIILLWGVMVGLIRILGERSDRPEMSPNLDDVKIQSDGSDKYMKMRAAVVAVACALTQDKQTHREFPLPPTAFVSAWQAVARSNMLKRGQVR